MAEIKSESVADFIPESPADFARNMQPAFTEDGIAHLRQIIADEKAAGCAPPRVNPPK
jgi:hypothetical protein